MLKHFPVFSLCLVVLAASCSLSAPADRSTATPSNSPTPEMTATPESSPTPKPTATESGPVKLQWYVPLAGDQPGADQAKAVNRLVEKFNLENGDRYQLTADFHSANEETGLPELAQVISTENAPDIVGVIGESWLAELREDWLDLSDLMNAASFHKEDFYPVVLDHFRWGSYGQVGVPIIVWPSALFYSKHFYRGNQLPFPPHTWEAEYKGAAWDFDAVKNLSRDYFTFDKKGRDTLKADFDPALTFRIGYHATLGSLFDQWGSMGSSSMVDAQGQVAIPEIWRSAARWYYDGMWKTHFIPNNNLIQNSEMFSMYWRENTFFNGSLAMTPQYLWYVDYAADKPPFVGLTVEWDLAAIPSFEGNRPVAPLYGNVLAIPKTSKRAQAAFEAISLLSDKYAPNLLEYFLRGQYLPARISQQQIYLDRMKNAHPDADAQVFLDSLNYTAPFNPYAQLPNFPEAKKRCEEFRTNYETHGDLDLDAELDQLEKDLQALADGS